MFYVMNDDELAIFDDNKEKLEKTREFMPQLEGQYTIETDIVTAEELTAHPNKVIVGDVEIEIEVPDFEIVEIEVEIHDVDEDGNYIYDDEGNPVTHKETRPVQKQVGTHTETITVKGLVVNPDYEAEEAAKREADFSKAFFNTSLGYVRRSVKMADGSHKDFLSDLLPIISMGVQAGQLVNILTYDKPPFDVDIEDWTKYQHTVVVTPQFIQECFLQLSADFAPINNEE